MKKNLQVLFVLFALLLFINNANSQGLYLKFGTGYAHMFSAQTINIAMLGTDFTSGSAGTNSYTVERVPVSLGKGGNFSGAFGIMFSKYVGMELGLSYLLGLKTKAKWTYPGGTQEEAFYSRMASFIPAIIITPGLDGVNPYARIGVLIGVGSIFYDMEDIDAGDKTVVKVKLNGGVAIGVNTAVGLQFKIGDYFGLFGEVCMVNMSYAPTKGEVIEATYNGVDDLPNWTTSEKEIEFVNEVTYSQSTPHPDSQPSQELKYNFPFGSFGINFGVLISLGK